MKLLIDDYQKYFDLLDIKLTDGMVVRMETLIRELQMPKGKGYSKHNPKASKMMNRNKTSQARFTNNGKTSVAKVPNPGAKMKKGSSSKRKY